MPKLAPCLVVMFMAVMCGVPCVHSDPPPSTTPPVAAAKPAPLPDAWPNLGRYKKDNEALPAPVAGDKRVIFYGDSITDFWARDKSFFPGKGYIGRGISGQTTMQMLVRFRADVIDLKPAVVVILAGTNDIAQNQGLTSMELIEADLQSMAELAIANHIRPILSSTLPASDFSWRRGLEPGPKIVELNKWIEDYCQKNNLVYLNYYPALVNDKLGMKAEYSKDGVHPNPAGYAIMAPLAEQAIAQALQ